MKTETWVTHTHCLVKRRKTKKKTCSVLEHMCVPGRETLLGCHDLLVSAVLVAALQVVPDYPHQL